MKKILRSVSSYTNILLAKKCATKEIRIKKISLTNHKISTQLYIIGTCNIKPAANSGSPALVYDSGKTGYLRSIFGPTSYLTSGNNPFLKSFFAK